MLRTIAFALLVHGIATVSAAAQWRERPPAAAEARPDIDGTVRPPRPRPLLLVPEAFVWRRTLEVRQDGALVAAYEERRVILGVALGVDAGSRDDVRIGIAAHYLEASPRAHDPALGGLRGVETRMQAIWTHAAQDDALVPASGVRLAAGIEHILTAPRIAASLGGGESNSALTKAELASTSFWSLRTRWRLFVASAAGTSFNGAPWLTEQFQLGQPLRLGAYAPGMLRGNNYSVITAGLLRRVGRLPRALGGPTFAGAWLESGTAFDRIGDATLHTDVGAGVIANTLIGPAVAGMGVAPDGRWRAYTGIGRVF